MVTLDRVRVSPNICGIELAFTGELLASSIPEWQPFYNSSKLGLDFTKIHIGLGSVSFNEESQESDAGTSYKQTVTIRFPSTDGNRSERIELMKRVRFIKLNLTVGEDIIIGRNDYKQNARPKINTKTNVKVAEIEFQTVSIFPSGFVSAADLVVSADPVFLQALIPLILY
jgi:hypothetical protein